MGLIDADDVQVTLADVIALVRVLESERRQVLRALQAAGVRLNEFAFSPADVSGFDERTSFILWLLLKGETHCGRAARALPLDGANVVRQTPEGDSAPG